MRAHLAGSLLAASLAAAPLASALPQGLPAAGGSGTPHSTMMPHRSEVSPPAAIGDAHPGTMPSTAAGQNRELDRIGAKLLADTPKTAPGATPSTGGGDVAPR